MQDGTVVTFGLGEALFALPVAEVIEIIDAEAPAPLPRAPAHLLGLIDRRGQSVPVADLRGLLGLAPRADHGDTRIIVMNLPGAGEPPHAVGLRVDRVIEVARLDGEGPVPLAEAGLLRWDERMVAGIGRREGRFVTVLRAEGLFEPDLAPSAALA